MRCRVLEIEASHGNQEALTELGSELAALRQRNETLDAELRQKDKEIETLRTAVQTGSGQQQAERHKVTLPIFKDNIFFNSNCRTPSSCSFSHLQVLLAENDSLRISVSRLQEQIDTQLRLSGSTTSGLSSRQPALEQLSARLETKISELRDLQAELAALVLTPPTPPQPAGAPSAGSS